jgi:hypothetical protein
VDVGSAVVWGVFSNRKHRGPRLIRMTDNVTLDVTAVLTHHWGCSSRRAQPWSHHSVQRAERPPTVGPGDVTSTVHQSSLSGVVCESINAALRVVALVDIADRTAFVRRCAHAACKLVLLLKAQDT